MNITFEQSKKLVTIGYPVDEYSCERYYNSKGQPMSWEYCGIEDKEFYPLIDVHEALQWFRDKKGIKCAVINDVNFLTKNRVSFNGYCGMYMITDELNFVIKQEYLETKESFHEAELDLLNALIKYEENK